MPPWLPCLPLGQARQANPVSTRYTLMPSSQCAPSNSTATVQAALLERATAASAIVVRPGGHDMQCGARDELVNLPMGHVKQRPCAAQ